MELFLTQPADAAKRLDHFLQDKLPAFSRSRVQEWIKAGRVRINGAAVSKAPASRRLGTGDARRLTDLGAMGEGLRVRVVGDVRLDGADLAALRSRTHC